MLFALGGATIFCWMLGSAVLATSKEETGPGVVGLLVTFTACVFAFLAGHFTP